MGDLARGAATVISAPVLGPAAFLGLETGNPIGATGDFLGVNPNKTNVSGYGPSAAELSFGNALMNQYQGTSGPSAAELQLYKGLDAANANANALAASGRGINPVLAQKMAMTNQAANQQGVNQDAGILRAQEALGAAGNLANLYSSQRQSAGQANALTAQANENASKRRSDLISSGGQAAATMLAAHGGMVPCYADGGMLPPHVTAFAQHLGQMAADKVLNMESGGPVPGTPTVPGDSTKNDKVPAMLSPGEIVIPRTVVAQGPNAISMFAQALMRGA